MSSAGGDLADIKAKKELEKTAKELEKLDIDISNAKAQVKLEKRKTWAAMLAPVMTAATVLGTVYIGYRQISAKSDSDEDANWRQTLTSIDETKPEDFAARHVATLLKPFLESLRYKTLAIGVTIDELPRLRDAATFRDLFSAAFPRPEAKDLAILLDSARRLSKVSGELDSAATAATDPAISSAKRDERGAVLNESTLLCEPIASILRNIDHKTVLRYFASSQRTSSMISLDNIYFEKCDFSGVDFSDLDLENSVFDYVKLDDANLKNVTNSSEFIWGGNIWWTAKYIEPELLMELLAHFKPYKFPDGWAPAYRDNEVVKRADWERNIKRLCTSAKLPCTNDQIHTEFPPSP